MDNTTPLHLSEMMRVNHRYDGTVIASTVDDLNIMHCNINHLTDKLYEVELYVASFPGILHVIAISETWLTVENCSTYKLLGYQDMHNFRTDSEGGGITLFIHDSICKIAPKVVVNTVTPHLNHFLVVELPSVDITVAIPYRRPESNNPNFHINTFLDQLQQHCLNRKNCFIAGDLNMNLLDVRNKSKLTDLFESHGHGILNAINSSAVTRRTSGTILDVSATNMLHHQYKQSIVHSQKSDHSILFISINRKIQRDIDTTSKVTFNLAEASKKVERFCENATVSCGNELNAALEQIVSQCTSVVNIKSDHRIKRPFPLTD